MQVEQNREKWQKLKKAYTDMVEKGQKEEKK